MIHLIKKNPPKLIRWSLYWTTLFLCVPRKPALHAGPVTGARSLGLHGELGGRARLGPVTGSQPGPRGPGDGAPLSLQPPTHPTRRLPVHTGTNLHVALSYFSNVALMSKLSRKGGAGTLCQSFFVFYYFIKSSFCLVPVVPVCLFKETLVLLTSQ